MREQLLEVKAPLLNVNDPESQVVEVMVRAGQKVNSGDVLCLLSTTKASFEVEAEISGYIHKTLIRPGELVRAGTVMFVIGPEEPPMASASSPAPGNGEVELIAGGPPITAPARELARRLGVDLSNLPQGILVTQDLVRSLAGEKSATGEPLATKRVRNANIVVIYGDGGHARMIIDLLRRGNLYQIAGLVADPKPEVSEVLSIKVLGDSQALARLVEDGVCLAINAVGGVRNPRARVDVFQRLAEMGFSFPVIVHPSAVLEPSAIVSAGAQVFAMAFIGSGTRIGFGAIVNTGAIVSHDCVVGEYAHITPGAVLAGAVVVGRGAVVGMGVTTEVGVQIGEWARIGNGARIHDDVPPGALIPAGTSWPQAGTHPKRSA